MGENLIATNYHVIEDGIAWELTISAAEHPLPLEVALADKANDLVLMRTRKEGAPLVPLPVEPSRATRLGEDVYGVGFPLTGLLGDGHKVSTGVLSGLSGLDSDPRFFQLTVPTQPGNSGGPIFNDRGDVIGILASTLSVDYLYKAAQTIPQNINFAIKSDYLLLLMSQLDLGKPATRGSRALSRADQIARAQPSIGVVTALAPLATKDDRNEVGSATRQTEPARRPSFPQLEVSYRHTSGPQILVRQRRENATITFYRNDSSIYGQGAVTWVAGANAFVGTAEIPYLCGSIDTRVTTVTSGLELHLEPSGTLRMRLQIPTKINCSRNQFEYAWGEDRWYPS